MARRSQCACTMQIRHCLALVVLCVSGVACAASCVQNTTALEADGASADVPAATAAGNERVGDEQEAIAYVDCKDMSIADCMMHCALEGIPCRP